MDLYLTSVLLVFVLVQCEAEVRVNLTAVVGSSITFPDPVKERGFFLYGSKTIASVYNGVFEIEEDIYTNRLHWNSSTGRFTLSDLQKSDSGVYTIDSKKGNVFLKYYELKLYKPLPLPVVSRVNVSADSCTLQCSVNLTEQTTLSWFRGEQRVDSSSSAVLLLTVQLQDNTSEHKCVAQNLADEKNVIVNITKKCQFVESQSNEDEGNSAAIIIPIVLTALIILCFVIVVIKKKCTQKGSTSSQIQGRVLTHLLHQDSQPIQI
ncbi:uncharacterized protein LOC110164353 isoform X2 [Boleophthalmus pectinirostris]|uniref:uncharacterized protein LOC110164353 isoform X2 n=1 Tax=Boleophthalmus pectinirostris TaxID=150288 RepID=UPI00242ED73F|nr:uncharacterized protein LOC110164353 isoform X2 [Boleophthalmus pectinirostris]